MTLRKRPRREMQIDRELERLVRHDRTGARADSRWVPLKPAPATCVTVPSGATSESRTNQFARGASALT
jgi:hypothetical protein